MPESPINPSNRVITEDEWDALLTNQKSVDDAANKGRAQFKGLSKREFHELRVRAKKDLFFCAFGVLGYTRLSTGLHGNLCQWMHATKRDRFREILLPRGHFKSTVITISHSLQCCLPYNELDLEYDQTRDSDPLEWPEALGTDVRLLIAHETHESASRYLFSITSHFLSNPTLMGLFPEAVPSPRIHRINKHELHLPRQKIWNEPTVDTMGVGAKGQGRHYNILKLDDVIGDKARDSAVEMQAAKDWLDNIQAFFSQFKQDKLDLIGTRWSNDDAYQHMEERYGKALKVYRRAVEEVDEVSGLKVPIFPEEFDSESLNILRKNRKVFSAQYENDPDAGSTLFQEEWIKYYQWQGANIVSTFTLDGVKGRLVNVRDMNVFILIDPAPKRKGGYIIAGMDSMRNIFVLKAEQGEWEPPELVEKIFSDVARWMPYAVGMEEVLFSELYRHWIMSEQRFRGVRFNMMPLDAKQKNKELRVRGLANPLSAGQIYVNEKFYSKEQDPKGMDSDLVYQLKKFGSIKEYHVLDALAYGPTVMVPGFPREKWNEIKEAQEQRFTGTDNVTGYSAIGD